MVTLNVSQSSLSFFFHLSVYSYCDSLPIIYLKAASKGVHVQVEFHKRWDPIYMDAQARIRSMGDFSYFQSFMSQPKFQLQVYKNSIHFLFVISHWVRVYIFSHLTLPLAVPILKMQLLLLFGRAYVCMRDHSQTFRAWAGISSDISYYLNSHHVDFHCWAMEGVSLSFLFCFVLFYWRLRTPN